MQLCEYGCGQEAKHQFKNGKWCCSKHYTKCERERKKIKNRPVDKIKYKKIGKKNKGKKRSNEFRERLRNINLGKITSTETRKKLKISNKKSIEYWKKKYPFFSKIEEMRYNPNKPGEKEIQVRCKNHKCENSKEKGGWFTPTYIQLYERIRQLESEEASAGCYFYCSQECKDICPLYNLKGDPYKDINLPYTSVEYQTFRTFVLERDNYICQFCGKLATDVHHERPQKLEPFFSLDPDYAWSCCEKCHYKKGHQDKCSTGSLAKIVCRNRGDNFI